MKTLQLAGALLLGASLLPVSAVAATSSDDPEALVRDGEFFGEIRYRYEHVDQGNIANKANAQTIRTNLGYKTGVYKNFQGLIEGQIVQNISKDDFNSTTNGNTNFPVVADPDVAEINELWVSWSGLPKTSFKLGRQKMNLDNQRFVGTVGWRQNDQTFDAFTITNSSIDNLDLIYSYIDNVNRIQGDDNALGDLEGETHIAHATYSYADWLKAVAYGHWLDLDLAPGLSSKTYGVRLTGTTPITEDWSFYYEAEAATQEDHGGNTASYDENYYHFVPGIKGHGFTFQLGYEELGGDGTNAFQTPLATAHKFNGWADLFLTTPGAGLEDRYVAGSYKFSNTDTPLDGSTLKAIYHEFEGDNNGTDFGEEINLSLAKSFDLPDAGQPFKKLNVLLKYADFESDNTQFPDTQRFWLQLGVKF